MKDKIKKYVAPFLFDYIKHIVYYKTYLSNKNLFLNNIALKNKHKGERCFILGSGTSINKEDIKPLKDEVVFALNNFYVHKDFQEIVKGTKEKYYLIAPVHLPQTEDEWRKWLIDIEKHVPIKTTMLFGLNGYKGNIRYLLNKYGIFKNHKIFWYFASKNFNYNRFNQEAMDITKPIFSGETVSIYALILAIYMGFDEIILLGMDHDYFLYDSTDEMRMYKDAIHQKNEMKRAFGKDFYIEEFNRQYKIFRKYRAIDLNSNSKIINASNGGILKIFEKEIFDEIIAK